MAFPSQPNKHAREERAPLPVGVFIRESQEISFFVRKGSDRLHRESPGVLCGKLEVWQNIREGLYRLTILLGTKRALSIIFDNFQQVVDVIRDLRVCTGCTDHNEEVPTFYRSTDDPACKICQMREALMGLPIGNCMVCFNQSIELHLLRCNDPRHALCVKCRAGCRNRCPMRCDVSTRTSIRTQQRMVPLAHEFIAIGPGVSNDEVLPELITTEDESDVSTTDVESGRSTPEYTHHQSVVPVI
jgi:hypothetical protein